MANYRSVQYLIPTFDVNMDGVMVQQALPTNQLEQFDPFLLLHHATFQFTENARALHQGIGPHPHRGFSPVTFIIEGEVHHRDSRGNSQIGTKGAVQWMHAGAGIVHSERPSPDLVNRNGQQEIVQLWINSPAAKKMQQPLYQYFEKDKFPIVRSSDGLVSNQLIAGSFTGYSGPVKTESELLILWSHGKKRGRDTYYIPKEMNTALYLIKGSLHLSGYGKVDPQSLVIFENDSELISLRVEDDAQLLLLAGGPINEKIARQGPFVMNTQTQILEAMRDYQMGKMGILIEE